jgi:heterodisulfide reductase subunit D
MGHQKGLEETVERTGVLRCLECGKCTAVCPISQYDHRFSPRRTVGRALLRHDNALLSDDRLWACLTCLHCSQVCPAAVAYSDLTLGVRVEARKLGGAVNCTHGEVIHAWMRMMADPTVRQNRLGWLDGGPKGDRVPIPSGGARTAAAEGCRASDDDRRPIVSGVESGFNGKPRVSEDSEVVYFVGCAPYFDAQFGHIGVDGGRVARATVWTLNALGIEPQVLADERCCGHDLLWEGDVEGFRELAQLNAASIRESGAGRVVTSCPECARALRVDYPAHGIDLGVEVLHLAELAARGEWRTVSADDAYTGMGLAYDGGPAQPAPDDELLRAQQRNKRFTYHDPCRLGRHLGVYDAPRQLLKGLGLELVEMQRFRENALCCGTNGWTHCGMANKQIQDERLYEAQATGADVLVTACLKCQIHFRCAMQDRELSAQIDIEIKDLAEVLAEALAELTPGQGSFL